MELRDPRQLRWALGVYVLWSMAVDVEQRQHWQRETPYLENSRGARDE